VSTVVGSGEDPIFRLWTVFVISEWACVVARLTAADDDFSGSSLIAFTGKKSRNGGERGPACELRQQGDGA
jgi:hypothetical protein